MRFGTLGLANQRPSPAANVDAADLGDGEAQFAFGFELGGFACADCPSARLAVGLDVRVLGLGQGDLHDDADREFLLGDSKVGLQRSQAFDLRVIRRIEPRSLGAALLGALLELLRLGDMLPRFVERCPAP
ncbi:MAG: hypothetical protein J4F45_15055 [Pseudomonadales bacterium]|nr:hypothetical protein [Pseudomonadales bacterium]